MNLEKEKVIVLSGIWLPIEEEISLEKLQETYEEQLKTWKIHNTTSSKGEVYDYCGWTVKAAMDYGYYNDNSVEFYMSIYRWETDSEFNYRYDRILEEEERRKKREAEHAKLLKEREAAQKKKKALEDARMMELLKDPEYLKLLELKKKFKV